LPAVDRPLPARRRSFLDKANPITVVSVRAPGHIALEATVIDDFNP
jgi:hypothetical protein